MKQISFLTIVFFIFSANFVLAEGIDNFSSVICAKTLPPMTLLKESAQFSRELHKQHCSISNSAVLSSALVSLLTKISGEAQIYTNQIPVDDLIYSLTSSRRTPNLISNSRPGANPGNIGDLYLVFDGHDHKIEDRPECNSDIGQYDQSKNCRDMTEEMEEIYNFVQNVHAARGAYSVASYLEVLDNQWDKFFKESRSQTPLELLINGKRFKNQSGRFLSPPKTQLIILHPTVMMEYVKDAPDGEQQREGLVLEIIGINRWERDKWYKPTGIALIAAYSDKPEIKDWGYGALLHFGNSIAIGAASYSGETGIFITADLLKIFQSKQKLLQKYGIN